ncbi:MAG: anti-sigma factor [Oscillospiraceae bacterium]
MSDCKKNIEMISCLIDGELPAEQEASLRAHINSCDNCKKVYEAFSGISDTLSNDLVEPPEMLAKGIMFKIKAAEKGGSKRRFAFGRFTAIAACFVVTMFAAARFGLPNALKSASPAPAALPEADYSIKATGAPVYEAAIENSDTTVQITENVVKPQPTPAPKTRDKAEAPVFPLGFPPRDVPMPQSNNILNVQNNGISPNAVIENDHPLFKEISEISIYKKDDFLPDSLLLTITDEETLKTFADIFKIKAIQIIEPPTQNPDYILLIPAKDNKTELAKLPTEEKGEDKKITLTVWIMDNELWCLDSETSILTKAEGTAHDLQKFIEEHTESPVINPLIR